jgi:hypothetical protein
VSGQHGNQHDVPGAPSDYTTVVEVLDALRARGYADDAFAREGGRIRWSCGHEAPAAEMTVAEFRRLEGASDPDDMQAVVAGDCPTCGQHGVLVVHYGPTASEADLDVMAGLPT